MTSLSTGRADAARNRARIVEVAREVWDASGDAPMQSIARRAGVGQGTLYRHFPTREALLGAVYSEDFQALLSAANGMLSTHEPLVALRRWLDALATFGRTKHALAGAFEAAAAARLHEEQYGPVTEAISTLLEAGRKTGGIRADVDAADLLALTGFLWHTNATEEQRLGHRLDLVVDAMRTQPPW